MLAKLTAILLGMLATLNGGNYLNAGGLVASEGEKVAIEERTDAIKNLVILDGQIKNIHFTDDNSGETFVIKTDAHNYYGFGGNSIVYFSVTNVSDTKQDALVAFSFETSQYVASVARNDGDFATHRIVAGTATTSEYTVTSTSTVWGDMSVREVAIPSVTRKSVGTAETKKGFNDTFDSGETKYYKASVRIPVGTQNDEWFVEAFGSKGDYGHLDPNLWTYEQKFNTLTLGDLTGQDSWTNDNTIPQVANTGTPYEGTQHGMYDGDTGNEYTSANRAVTAVESGTVYTSIKVTNDDNIVRLGLYDATGLSAAVTFRNDAKIHYYAGTALVDSGVTYNANQYYRIGIQFETSGNAYEGLGTDKWKYNIDGGAFSSEYALYTGGGGGGGTSITSIRIFGEFDITNTGIMYFDYISPDYAASTPATAVSNLQVIFFDE